MQGVVEADLETIMAGLGDDDAGGLQSHERIRVDERFEHVDVERAAERDQLDRPSFIGIERGQAGGEEVGHGAGRRQLAHRHDEPVAPVERALSIRLDE